jgi:hypothetical protein
LKKKQSLFTSSPLCSFCLPGWVEKKAVAHGTLRIGLFGNERACHHSSKKGKPIYSKINTFIIKNKSN